MRGTLLLALCGASCAACPTATLVWLPPFSQVNRTTSPGNDYGVEDGIVVRRADGAFTMICAEMYGAHKWVAMRLGVYGSPDGLAWTRVRALRTSTADFTGRDPHSSSWGPFFVHDPANSTWLLSYVGYRGAPSNASGWLENFEGTIYARYANASGDAGLDSDFFDAAPGGGFAGDATLLAPDDFNVAGPWPHVCQGLQGTDSMYPYALPDGTWAAFVGTSHQEASNAYGPGKWPVSLATAPALGGPWTRLNPQGGAPADAPCVDLNGGFSENPIVARRPDNERAFHVVLDDLADEAGGFGYGCSEDGLRWARAARVAVPGGCRTPFGLVPLAPREEAQRRADVLAYGVLNASQYGAPNTSLQWLFYSSTVGGWEEFRAAIVQLAW